MSYYNEENPYEDVEETDDLPEEPEPSTSITSYVYETSYAKLAKELTKDYPILKVEKPSKHQNIVGISEQDCIGPNSPYLKFISNDYQEFLVKRKHAFVSRKIADMLSGPGQYKEGETNIIYFNYVKGEVLDLICDYLEFHYVYSKNCEKIPRFIVPDELGMDVFLAANFLEI